MSLWLEPIEMPEDTPEGKYDYFLLRDGERDEVGDFLKSLQPEDRDIFYDRFRVTSVRGKDNMNPGSFRNLHGYGDLYEFKTGRGYRIACFFSDKRCILVEGWRKETDRATNRDKRSYERAQTRMRMFLDQGEEL